MWIVLGLLTIVAAALRLPFLGHQSLWLDETYTRDIVGEPTLSGLWRQIQGTESTPPLYYLIGWMLGGRSGASMRAIPALALVATVPAGFLAFRRFVGQRAALAAAAILAVSPILVSYSTDARSYGLLVLTALLSVWAVSELLSSSSRWCFALWAVSSVACAWTHYFGAFVVAAEVLVLLITLPRARASTVCWTALVVVCMTPLVPLAVRQAGDQRAEFIAGMPLGSRLTDAVREFAMGPNVPRTWLEAAGLGIFVLCTGAGIALAARSSGGPRVLLAIAVIAFGVPLLMAVLGIDDLFYARNVIAVAPLAAALAAPVMLALRAAPLAAYVSLALVTSVWVASDWRYEQVDWRSAIGRVETIDPNAAVVALNGEPVARTYLGRQPTPALVTRRAWIVVPPVRTAGHRALGPAPAPAPGLPGFTTLRTLELHGFRLILVNARRLRTIALGAIPGSLLFPGRSQHDRRRLCR